MVREHVYSEESDPHQRLRLEVNRHGKTYLVVSSLPLNRPHHFDGGNEHVHRFIIQLRLNYTSISDSTMKTISSEKRICLQVVSPDDFSAYSKSSEQILPRRAFGPSGAQPKV